MTSPDYTRTGVARPLAAALSPSRSVLDNGVSVVVRETHKTAAATISLAMRSGSACDPPHGEGATHLLSRLIDRGTPRHSADELAESLESRGVSLATTVSRHQVSMVCTCLSEDFAHVLGVLAEMLIEPTIPDAELVTRRTEVLTAIAQDRDSPYVMALDELLGLLYGVDHPYGRPAKGTPETVAQMTRNALLGLHHERFAPSELCLVVVGEVDRNHVMDEAARVFGAWRAPRPAPGSLAHPDPRSARRRRVVPMPGKAQADIAYGFTAIARSDPDYYACRLMNNVFGQYAIGGRLGDSIRERQGMAYYVSSSLEAGLVEGPLVIRAGVSPANVERTIASIDDEVRRMRTEGVTEQELSESRQYLLGSMPRTLETNAGIAAFLQNVEFFGLGLDYDARLPQLLGAVTRDDVNAAARRLLDPDRAAITVAGPRA